MPLSLETSAFMLRATRSASRRSGAPSGACSGIVRPSSPCSSARATAPVSGGMPGELIEELVEGGERRGILPAQIGDVRSLGQLAVDGYAPAAAIALPADPGISR